MMVIGGGVDGVEMMVGLMVLVVVVVVVMVGLMVVIVEVRKVEALVMI